jgi:hypothetical protein
MTVHPIKSRKQRKRAKGSRFSKRIAGNEVED